MSTMEKSRRFGSAAPNMSKKHLELSKRWRIFARKKRRGKRVERKDARKKHKATRARSRLDELTFGTFTVITAAINGANVIDHIDTVLRPYAVKGFDVNGLKETKRDGTFGIMASVSRVYFNGDCSGVKAEKSNIELNWRRRRRSLKRLQGRHRN